MVTIMVLAQNYIEFFVIMKNIKENYPGICMLLVSHDSAIIPSSSQKIEL